MSAKYINFLADVEIHRNTRKVCRGWPVLRQLWRKAVFKQMLLLRMEREARRRRGVFVLSIDVAL